jgi:hypothetical protein
VPQFNAESSDRDQRALCADAAWHGDLPRQTINLSFYEDDQIMKIDALLAEEVG